MSDGSIDIAQEARRQAHDIPLEQLNPAQPELFSGDVMWEHFARLRREGRSVAIVGYNRASADIVDRFALHDKTGVELGTVPR